jgi:hypothetical protein
MASCNHPAYPLVSLQQVRPDACRHHGFRRDGSWEVKPEIRKFIPLSDCRNDGILAERGGRSRNRSRVRCAEVTNGGAHGANHSFPGKLPSMLMILRLCRSPLTMCVGPQAESQRQGEGECGHRIIEIARRDELRDCVLKEAKGIYCQSDFDLLHPWTRGSCSCGPVQNASTLPES